MDWNPLSSESWANLLGLVRVPLFANPNHIAGFRESAILLDGRRGTFAFFHVSDGLRCSAEDTLSWAWSANVLHTVTVSARNPDLRVGRWDAPSRPDVYRLPTKGIAAEELFESLAASPRARASTVVRHVLDGFRLIRRTLPPTATVDAIQLLNAFLLSASRASKEPAIHRQLQSARTYDDLLHSLGSQLIQHLGLANLSASLRTEPIGTIAQHFLQPEPRTGCQLDPDLLFRHASTDLYQEAHLELKREAQSYLPGIAPTSPPIGAMPKDVRFTPPNLARILVERALAAFGPLPRTLVVLDPACGSGVFLQECLRELAARNFTGQLSLHGFDVSPVASRICKFCLSEPVREALDPNLAVNIDIKTMDALTCDHWASPHLILMNPPFIARDSLSSQQLTAAQNVLGDDLAVGRIDIAMAFIWKAASVLQPGGVLATVIPAGLLETRSGQAWRNALAGLCDIHLLGRFEGYKYFETSMVETAFAVLRKRTVTPAPPQSISVLVAREGCEDAAIRLLRFAQQGISKQVDGVDYYHAEASQILGTRWTPLPHTTYSLRERTQHAALPSVSQLFRVQQGIRTRWKPAFVIKADHYERLPDKEKRFFRPAAGQRTIADGRLRPHEYVFYPYDEAGLLIETEDELRKHLPTYYETVLSRFRERLGEGRWWTLFRPRTWQYGQEPKLISKTYGGPGDFAFDTTGEYVVVQGCAWSWRRRNPSFFDQSPLPLAYLALLNSTVFAVLLSVYCRRVQGGQFELAKKYVAPIPLPDLATVDSATVATAERLAEFGRSIQQNGLRAIIKDLDRIAASAYGLPQGVTDEFVRAAEERRYAIHG